MSAADQFLHAVDRRRRWILAAAAILLLASFSTHWRITPDSAVFLGIARNLAHGRGFTFNEQIVTTVNPAFPYLLTLLRRLPIDSVIASNALVMFFGFASLVLVYRLILRQAGRPLAVLVTALTAATSPFLRHSCEILADVPFFFFCTLALLGYERTFPRPQSTSNDLQASELPAAERPARRAIAWAMVLVGLAGMASLRVVFLGPLVAILVDLLWRIRKSRFKWAVLAAALGVLLVALSIRLADPRMSGGIVLLTKEKQLLDLLLDLPARVPYILSTNGPRLFFDSTPRAMFGNKLGLWPLDLLLSLAVLAAGAILLRRRLAWAALIAIFFVQWLVLFPDTRYFLPLIPLLLLGWWDLAVTVTCRVPARLQPGVLVALIAVVALPNVIRSAGFVIEQHRRPFLENYLHGRYQDLQAVSELAARELPPDAVIIAGGQFATPLHYFSGLHSIATADQFLITPIPPGRKVFVLFPADPDFEAVAKRDNITVEPPVISGPDRGSATLRIAPIREQ